MPARKGGHEIFAESGKTGLTNAAMRGIIYLAFAGVAHLVERDLAKVEVASSSLVARSKKKNHPLGGFSFWNAADRMELAAATSAKRVKSRGEGRAPANGSAIRGMPVASRASSILLRRARKMKKNRPLGGLSFWNAAGRMELAASTCAQRVKSRGKGRAPANGSAIRGMPGSEFEPRLFCCAEREK